MSNHGDSHRPLLALSCLLSLLFCVSACNPIAATPAPSKPAAATAPGANGAKKSAAGETTDASSHSARTGANSTAAAPAIGSSSNPSATAAPSIDDSVYKASQSLYGGVREETLSNGLRVYLKPIAGAPTVTTMVAYRVGSADEDLDHTGLSHYLEHLMFKGTEKLKPGDIDRMTLVNGGANNAYTAEDHTIFHFDFANDRWEQALAVEADRMQNLRIDAAHEFEQEKGAVIEELRQDEDQPWDLEQKAILPLLFGAKSPYGHPVIGVTEHVRGATAATIKAYYDRWYHPNNACLIICGGFDPDSALAKVKELFGPIPQVELPARKDLSAEKLERPAHLDMKSKFEAPRLLIGFNTVRRDDPDYYPLDIVQGLLTGGKTGRLYKKLVEELQVATDVTCINTGGRYPGWFSIQLTLLPDVKIEDVEKIVLEELRQLGRNGITDSELKRVQTMYVAQELFTREGVHELADNIAQNVVLKDLNLAKDYLPNIIKVTPADVQRVSKKYFDAKQRVSVYSQPDKPPAESGGENKKSAEKPSAKRAAAPRQPAAPAGGPLGSRAAHGRRAASKIATEGAKPADVTEILKGAKRVVLDNGLTLLLLENHRLPIVAVQSYVGKTRLVEPDDKAGIAALVGDLLEEGSATRTGEEVAETIEDLGGSIAFDPSSGMLKMLAQDRHAGLEVLFDCLANADFPQDAFERSQGQMLAEIEEHEKQPEVKAQELFRKLIYGDHPLGRPQIGRTETVEKLTREDCLKFHRRMFVPNNTAVAIVGDFNTADVIQEIKSLTADWKKGQIDLPVLPKVEKPAQFEQKIISLPHAAQLHLFLGHVGIRRDNPDYYKLLVMDYVLGVGPGFTDRLSSRLRDRNGLAYSVGADIHSSATEQPGMFICHIGADPKNFDKVKSLLLEEINKFITAKPEAHEVEGAKQYLTGNLPFKSSTGDRLAAELLEIERYHLGENYLRDYERAVEAVTVDDVFEVAKKYLDPSHMILVAAGAIDEDGKPLAKEPDKPLAKEPDKP